MKLVQHLKEIHTNMYTYKMTQHSVLKFPKELVGVILDYEGSLIRAWQLDFVKHTYIEAYKRYFGDSVTFEKICRPNSYLHLYVHFSNWVQNNNVWTRERASKKHMKPWRALFPAQCSNLKKKAIIDSQYACNILKLICNKRNSLKQTKRTRMRLSR